MASVFSFETANGEIVQIRGNFEMQVISKKSVERLASLPNDKLPQDGKRMLGDKGRTSVGPGAYFGNSWASYWAETQ